MSHCNRRIGRITSNPKKSDCLGWYNKHTKQWEFNKEITRAMKQEAEALVKK